MSGRLWVGHDPQTVRRIRVQIGEEWAEHNFGREVSLEHARKMANHFVAVFTGAPSPFEAEP